MQTKLSTPSWQTVPPKHGCDAHSLMLLSQYRPLQPTLQKHTKPSGDSRQVAPFAHGCDSHSLISAAQPIVSFERRKQRAGKAGEANQFDRERLTCQQDTRT